MAAITYDPATSATPAARRPGVFRRFMRALQESRMRQAERELSRYRHLMPEELERAAARLDRRSEDALPFVR
jgi:hypothetical protein